MKLKVLSAGAVKRGVAQIAAAFGKAHGVEVEIEFTPPSTRSSPSATRSEKPSGSIRG